MNKIASIVLFSSISLQAFSQAPMATPVASTLVLANNWNSSMHGGTNTMKDLGALLSPFFQPQINLASTPGLVIYEQVTYLMPLAEAIKTLNLTDKLPARNRMAGAGFPKDSLSYYVFNGIFEGHYNHLYLVTDIANQVVCVQLVAEAPEKSWVRRPSRETGWHVYNFVTSKSKATNSLWIDHETSYLDGSQWRIFNPKYTSSTNASKSKAAQVLRIDTVVINPYATRTGYVSNDWKPLEVVRWYIPRPLGELLMYRVTR